MSAEQDNEAAAGSGSRRWRAPFAGGLVALLLLACVEAVLHTDAFLYRYRSVFAAGRAMDKVLAVEAKPATVLAVGNSRVDNGIHPGEFQRETGLTAFNLGLPGAEACNLEGVIARLADRKLFGPGRIEQVLFGLDESLLQRSGGLGYEVWFDLPSRLLAHGRPADWLRSRLRLWGYADSLRTLQEPEKLVRFMKATFGEVESWGGNAEATAGFRAADEAMNQDAGQVQVQATSQRRAPDPAVLECFWAATERVQQAGAQVAVVFMPTLMGANPFDADAREADGAYARIKDSFRARGVSVLEFDAEPIRQGRFFANAGHLNREGASQFTRLMASRFAAAGGVRHGRTVSSVED